MAEPIADYGSFFNGAKNALLELDTLSTEEERLTLEKDRIRGAIDADIKAANSKIDDILDKRLKELTSSYEGELKKAQGVLKAAEAKKEKARSKKKGERIKEETKDLREHISSIKESIKEEMRKNKVPGFCNTGAYFTFYLPNKILDYIKILLCIVIVFLALPLIIYRLIPVHKLMLLPFIYFGVSVLTGGIYIILGNLTKARNRKALIKIRNMRDIIANDHKRIKLVIKEIDNEVEEQSYDLTDYDEKIREAGAKVKELNAKRTAALKEFESSTQNIIRDEIMESTRANRESLEAELEFTKKSLENIAARRSEINLHISDKYEVYLGRDFLSVEKIEALEKMIGEGKAANIMEAMELYEHQQNG